MRSEGFIFVAASCSCSSARKASKSLGVGARLNKKRSSSVILLCAGAPPDCRRRCGGLSSSCDEGPTGTPAGVRGTVLYRLQCVSEDCRRMCRGGETVFSTSSTPCDATVNPWRPSPNYLSAVVKARATSLNNVHRSLQQATYKFGERDTALPGTGKLSPN